MSDEREWDDLARQAERHGVALRYHSFWGEDKAVPAELETIQAACRAIGVEAISCNHWAEGSAGAADLAKA